MPTLTLGRDLFDPGYGAAATRCNVELQDRQGPLPWHLQLVSRDIQLKLRLLVVQGLGLILGVSESTEYNPSLGFLALGSARR